MGRRQSWTDHRLMKSRHSNFRLPNPMSRYAKDQYWRRGKGARFIIDVIADSVVYVLYARRKTKQGYRWVKVRSEGCAHDVWVKWAKGAVPLEGV